MQMLRLELEGTKYVKAQFNRDLRANELAARNKGSVERRMQNISAVMQELKLPFIRGYLPIGNVGARVKPIIISAIEKHSVGMPWVATSDPELLDERVSVMLQQPLVETPAGNDTPKKTLSQVTAFERSPAVKAWVLKHAGPFCEGCHAVAPFEIKPGVPYLEVHHVIPLAENGADTVENAVALCPNCHRRCHYALGREEFIRELYVKVPRLLPRPTEEDILNTFI